MRHPIVKQIKDLLDQNVLWYRYFEHKPVKTSEEAAEIRPDYTLEQGAKALILRVKKNKEVFFTMIVIPGNTKFDKKKVQKSLEIKNFRFATQEEINKITEGVQIGGIPPFGNLFGIKVYADEKILNVEKIIFNAGDRGISIAMRSVDYKNLVKPIISQLVE